MRIPTTAKSIDFQVQKKVLEINQRHRELGLEVEFDSVPVLPDSDV